MKTKVLIIGAGPAGSMTAYRLAQKGFLDFVIVDRCDFPRGKPCAGGISPSSHRFLQKIGLDSMLSELSPSASMKRVRFIGPSGQNLLLSSNLKAMAVNRRIFDQALLDKAKMLGATFVPGFTVRKLIRDSRGKIIGAEDHDKKIESEVTILATGGRNKEFRDEYFVDKRPLRLIYSRISWWKGFDIEPGLMEMVYDKNFLPHYGWVFPEGDNMVNIGVCLYKDKMNGKNVKEVFDEFLERYYAKRLARATQVGRSQSFVINTDSSVKHVYANRMLYAGEAGRMCNPATAEGISYALESGYLAAEAVASAYAKSRGGAPDEKTLESYESRCHKAFNFRLRRASLFSKLVETPVFNAMINVSMTSFSQKTISRLFGDT